MNRNFRRAMKKAKDGTAKVAHRPDNTELQPNANKDPVDVMVRVTNRQVVIHTGISICPGCGLKQVGQLPEDVASRLLGGQVVDGLSCQACGQPLLLRIDRQHDRLICTPSEYARGVIGK